MRKQSRILAYLSEAIKARGLIGGFIITCERRMLQVVHVFYSFVVNNLFILILKS